MAKDAFVLDALAAALLQELPDFAAQERAIRFLSAFAFLFEQDGDVRASFVHARNEGDFGVRCLREAVATMTDDVVINAMIVLMRQGMMDRFPLFTHRVIEQWEENGQGREATVVSATPLQESDRDRLQRSLAKKWKMPVMLTEETDASLLVGFRIRSGDWRYDASMKGKIKAIRKAMAG